MRAAKNAVFLTTLLCACMGGVVVLTPRPAPAKAKLYVGMSEPEARVFNRACRDCHSNDTAWPWYSKLPPLSLGIVADVRRGRQAWNISDWAAYTKGRKLGFLSAIVADAQNNNMPPRAYRWMHRESVLQEKDRVLLSKWAIAERARIRVAAANPVAAR